jgi:hypothetical protein
MYPIRQARRIVRTEGKEMKIDVRSVVQAVVIALLLAVLTAAGSTYVEVKMLRKDVDALWSDTSEQIQDHGETHKKLEEDIKYLERAMPRMAEREPSE